MTAKEFCSWIPTVTGNLSFSAIGQSTWPRPCISLNRVERQGIGLFLQKRYLLDVVFPGLGMSDAFKDFLFRSASRFSGKIYFCCHIYKISKDDDGDKDSLDGIIFPLLATDVGLNAANGIRSCIVKWIPNPSQAKDDLTSTVNLARAASPLICNFTLRRNGLLRISVGKKDLQSIPKLEPLSDRDVKYLVEQCFFFLRDIVHNHQHHDPANDTVVRLHENKAYWEKQVYYDLFRKVIAFKRKRTEAHIINALGILSYAESFKKIVEADVKLTEFNIKEIEKSLESARFELSHKTQKAIKFSDGLQTLVFSASGLVISIILLMSLAPEAQRSDFPVSPIISTLAQFFMVHPLKALTIITCICFIIMIFRGNLKVEYWSVIEDFQRLFQHLKRARAGALFVIIGMSMYVLSYLVLHLI